MLLIDKQFSFEPAFACSRQILRDRKTLFYVTCVTMLLSSGVHATPFADQHMTFSIDVQGPTAGTGIPDSFSGLPIRGSDILTPSWKGPPGPNPAGSFGPFPLSQPGIYIRPPIIQSSPFLNNFNGWAEVDALSFGHDPLYAPDGHCFGYGCWHIFSVDEFAIGLPGTDLRTEGALGNMEASADTFRSSELKLPTTAVLGRNSYYTDGDGREFRDFSQGVGLIEPNFPTPLSGGIPGQIDLGDNLDAVDFVKKLSDVNPPFYGSLDSAFYDPLETGLVAWPPNYSTAASNGVVGGDVLVGFEGGGAALYASAIQLGLDRFGPDTDDLDALKLHENGIDGYQQSLVPFDWINGQADMLLFSIRRNSATISLLDSIFGLPIEEGDILTTSCPAGSLLPNGTVCFGGSAPGIFVAAESLGLATVRSGTAASYGVINPIYGIDVWADDLDAYDQVVPEPHIITLLMIGLIGMVLMLRRHTALV